MIDDIKQDTEERMGKTLEALSTTLIRFARAGRTRAYWTVSGSSITAPKRRSISWLTSTSKTPER